MKVDKNWKFYKEIKQIFDVVYDYEENKKTGMIYFNTSTNTICLTTLEELSQLLKTSSISFTGIQEEYYEYGYKNIKDAGEIKCIEVNFN